jgi:hypothetical protein
VGLGEDGAGGDGERGGECGETWGEAHGGGLLVGIDGEAAVGAGVQRRLPAYDLGWGGVVSGILWEGCVIWGSGFVYTAYVRIRYGIGGHCEP